MHRNLVGPLILVCCSLAAAPKEKVMRISWGDVIVGDFEGVALLDTPDKVRKAARRWKAGGIRKVFFRADDFRVLLFHRFNPTADTHHRWLETTQAAWDSGLLETVVDALREQEIASYVWVTVLDQGCPPEVLYGDSVPFPWQSRFTAENPQYLACDRSLTIDGRRHHWGVMEYAYPQVRHYMLDVIRTFSDRFRFDGVYLSLRSHSPPARHADEFGFNQPIVQEYRRRYGRDILRQTFDLEKWRALRGEYFTTFLRELKSHLGKRGQNLCVGVPQGDYLGPPFGNLKIDWRAWVSEGIIDDLLVGHVAGRGLYPHRTQRAMGYLQSQEDGLGLAPIEQSLRQDYGPACRRAGVRLYVHPGGFYRTFPEPAYGRGKQPQRVRERLVEELETIPGVTGILYEYRTIMELPQGTRRQPGIPRSGDPSPYFSVDRWISFRENEDRRRLRSQPEIWASGEGNVPRYTLSSLRGLAGPSKFQRQVIQVVDEGFYLLDSQRFGPSLVE